MSTIKVDNIRIASESVSRPVTGVAAAWCVFNDTTLIKNMNVSSTTNNSRGNNTVNLTNNMSGSIYTITATGGSSTKTHVQTFYSVSSTGYGILNQMWETSNFADHNCTIGSEIHGDLA